MRPGYIIGEGLGEFAAATEQFSYLVNQLQCEPVMHMEHGEVEQVISQEGTELVRLLLQGYMHRRAALECKRKEVKGADGITRTQCRKHYERALMSLFGEVTINRMRYGARGQKSIFPLDAELNLPRDKYSHGLRKRVAEEVAKNSFDEAVASVQASTGGKVPKRQAEQIAAEVSQDFTVFYETRQADGPEETTDHLIMSVDGMGIVICVKRVFAKSRARRPKEPHTSSRRV